MACPSRNFEEWNMRVSRFIVPGAFCAALLFAARLAGQQTPFVPVTGPNPPPKGAAFLFEDSHGALWMGGSEEGAEGLTYFDGSRFISPVDGGPKLFVSGMAEDNEGGIWISSRSGLYRLFKRQLHKVLDGVAAHGLTKVAPDTFLTSIASPDRNESADGDLVRIMKVSGEWKTATIAKAASAVWFRPDRSGNVLYPCPEGFCELRSADIRSWRPGSVLAVKRYPLTVHTTDGVVARDRFGCIWMRSRIDAMYQCPGDARPTVLPSSVAGFAVPAIHELVDGSIALPGMSEMAIGRPGKFRVVTTANGYPSCGNSIVASDGQIWLSSSRGLFVYSTRDLAEFWTERDGLDGSVWSVVAVGNKMFAIAGSNIRVLSEDRSRWQRLAELDGATHLLAGPANTIFASSQRGGVVQLDQKGKILRRSDATNATMLARTPDGQFWASGTSLSTVTLSGRRLILKPASLPWPQNYTTDIKVDRDGGLWAASDSGLIHWNNGHWHRISTGDGLLENRCFSFAIDKTGDIWYSYAKVPAFSRIQDPAGPHRAIRHFSNGGEIGTAQSYFFESDSRGWLWRGVADGIYIAEPEQARQGQWLHFDLADGLPATNAGEFSFFEDKDGSVWFGVESAIMHWLPSGDLVQPKYSPSVFVSGFSWNGGAFQMASAVDEIKHGADIVAHIGSLQFDRRNALRFRYRLLPEQTRWTPQRNLDITLGKLSWGKHTLEVQARLYTGPWSATVTKSFTILKPFWLSWPALLGFAAAGGLAAGASCRWRRKLRRRAQTELPGLADWRLTALTPDIAGLQGAVLDGRFEVGRILARGGFATVFEGRDSQQGRACAVKIFRHELLEKNWMAKRFQQEVSALQQIQHANVVRIYGHGTAPSDAPYLAMELIVGKTLRELLTETRLDRQRTASYLRQTGGALAEIHEHGIRHRDLKPENLMIRSAAASGKELVLIDFSIAIVQDPDETMHGLSRAAGTLHYMAPEQGVGYADESSDIYSLSKILIEMLTGQRVSSLLPEASLDLSAQIRAFLKEKRFGLSSASIDLVACALEFDPARRPKNAKEFSVRIAQDLEREPTAL